MKNIKVNRDELLKRLKENRKKHVIEYKESLRGYRIKAIERLTKELNKAKNGKKFELYINLDKPTSREEEYVDAIAYFEMHECEQIELEPTDFRKFVLNKWDWSGGWSNTHSGYSGYSGYSGTGTSGSSGSFGTAGISGQDGLDPEEDDIIEIDLTQTKFAEDEDIPDKSENPLACSGY